MKPKITILTPTFQRPLAIVKRCIDAVRAQTCPAWLHWICTDGPEEAPIKELVAQANKEMGEEKIVYNATGFVRGHYGAGVRAHLLGLVATPFVCFVDDDAFVLPRYIEVALKALQEDQEAAFAVVPIIHHGPLPEWHGPPPKVLSGNPVRVGNVDTLQIIARTAEMKQTGWQLAGYQSDGVTFERLATNYPCIFVDEVLGVHL